MSSRYHGKAKIRRTPKHLEEAYSRLSRWRRRKVSRLSEAQGHRCAYCCCETYIGEQIPEGMSSRQRATLEHLIIQSSDSQTNLDSNLVMACSRCNGLRGEKNPMKFYKRIRIDTIITGPLPLTDKQKAKKLKKHLRGILLCMTILRHWPDIANEVRSAGEAALIAKRDRDKQTVQWRLKKIYESIMADPRIPA